VEVSAARNEPFVPLKQLSGFWAGSGKAAFVSLSGLSGQRLLTESQAGALDNDLEKPLLA
jgi:hypothetical protein